MGKQINPPEPEPEPTAEAVRAWARDRGYSVGRRGRLPRLVVEAFKREPKRVQRHYTKGEVR